MYNMLTTFLSSVLIGLAIAAPVGPIGLLCIRRTLTEGRISGIISGLGAASADAFYGLVAAFGLTFVSGLLIGYRDTLSVVGGLFLCYLGVRTFLTPPAETAMSVSNHTLIGAYTSTLFLTLTNPVTILSFIAIFAGFGVIDANGDYAIASIIVLGVFTGSALWWLMLAAGVNLIRTRLNMDAMRWINRLAGIIITGFGILAFLSGL